MLQVSDNNNWCILGEGGCLIFKKIIGVCVYINLTNTSIIFRYLVLDIADVVTENIIVHFPKVEYYNFY